VKQVIPYLVVSTFTLVLAVLVVFLIYSLRGDVTNGIKTPSPAEKPEVAVNADSAVSRPDSTNATKTDSLPPDSTAFIATERAEDSLRVILEKLQQETAKAALLEQRLAAQTGGSDSLHEKKVKNIAKMLETMSAEDAAKILKNLEMSEAKEVLMSVKKKQAGKILSALEPRYAARMMR